MNKMIRDRLVIEDRLKGDPIKMGHSWKPCAYPKNSFDDAKRVLDWLREEDKKKTYQHEFRIVRETKEILFDTYDSSSEK